MNAGCFVKTLIIGTIALGAVIYLITEKGKAWIVDPLKQKVSQEAFAALPEAMTKFKVNTESIRLKQHIDSLITAFKQDSAAASINLSKAENFMKALGQSSLDSVLSKSEYEKLLKLSQDIITFEQKNLNENNGN